MERTWLFIHVGLDCLQNPHFFSRMDLVSDIATYRKRSMRPNTFDVSFPFLSFFPKLFCFSIVLKCVGSHILGLRGRTLNACRVLLRLVGQICCI